MIAINLLPPELRKRQKRKLQLPELDFIPVGIGAATFLLSIYLLLGISTGLRRHHLNILEKKWAALKPQRDEADNLKAQLLKLRNEAQAIEGLERREFLWSEKLNQLSDLMVPRVWLSSLSIAQRLRREGKTERGTQPVAGSERILLISGGVASQGADEATYVGRFMGGLSQDEGFYKDFSKIELKSIQRRRVGASDVADFILECSFK